MSTAPGCVQTYDPEVISPADEFPLHQSPRPIAEPATSDRNFYDRCYFNAHDATGEVFLVTGLGVYPNQGVIDAYATVAHAGEQATVRMSDALGSDRLDQRVGPYSIEVIEPLHRVRVRCDADRLGSHPIGFDLEWTGSFPVVQEQPHVMRKGHRVILDACRFAQLGLWSGELRLSGERIAVEAERWMGNRDRSWGIRPVGPADPSDRGDAEMPPDWGMWWVYCPLRFDDVAVIVILQEDGNGFRTLNDALLVHTDGTTEQLGWPRVMVDYVPGSRTVASARIAADGPQGVTTIDVTSVGSVALNAGPGYGGDPQWTHGLWKGRHWLDSSTVRMDDPTVAAMLPFATVDHVVEATLVSPDGTVRRGAGMFEHMSIGAHRPSGFDDLSAVGS